MFLKGAFFYNNKSCDDGRDQHSHAPGFEGIDSDLIVAEHHKEILELTSQPHDQSNTNAEQDDFTRSHSLKYNRNASEDRNNNNEHVERPVPVIYDSMSDLGDMLIRLRDDIHCFHCTLVCKDVLGLVKNINNGIKVKAFVCSFSCMIAYAQDHAKSKQKLNRYMQYVENVFSYRYGKCLKLVEASPSPKCMIQFGGIKTVSQYREELQGINTRIANTT